MDTNTPQTPELVFASRDEFLTPTGRRYLGFTLPVSGRNVRIRSLFENEKEAYESKMLSHKGGLSLAALKEARRRLVQITLVNPAGDLLLAESDISKLSALDGADIACCYENAMTHCGFKQEEIEGLLKNSGSVRADA
ncbi:MAG: hypothetical protein V4719_10075 [Planctomycetota bacterium]